MEFLNDFFGRLFQANKPAEHNAIPGGEPVSAIVGIEFYNRQQSKLLLWIEPDCLEIDLNSTTEYRIEFDGFEYRFEFQNDSITFYLQDINAVLRIFERAHSNSYKNPDHWILTADYSDYPGKFKSIL